MFYHILCLLVGGFLAAWAISINEVRFSDKTYQSRWIWLLIWVLLSLSLGVATLNV